MGGGGGGGKKRESDGVEEKRKCQLLLVSRQTNCIAHLRRPGIYCLSHRRFNGKAI